MSNNLLVREGYDKAAENYLSHRNQSPNFRYLEQFIKLINKGKTILDVGCGAGKPIDEFLINHGFAVNGIDISSKQIELAKRNVPKAFYEVKDMSGLKDEEYCVDGIVSFYSIFHTPREKHQEIFNKFASFMPNGGAILVTMGAGEYEGWEENFHGVKMFWSHYGPERNKAIIDKAGFEIILNEIDNSTSGEKHQIIIAEKKG